ncbi:MAG: hypothetical protein Q4D02_08470 [Clostridia bacterium]|nr:hypothetical protein [Clostridia bacterium]
MEHKDIDKIIRNSYENVKIPDNLFENAYSNLEYKKPHTWYFKYAAVFVLIIGITITLIIILNKQNKNENIQTPNVAVEKPIQNEEKKLPVASSIINLIGDEYVQNRNLFISPVGLNLVEEETQNIVVVKLEKILYYTNYIEKRNVYTITPFTASKVSVVKSYKGNLTGELEIMSYGGVITLSDYEKACEPEQIKKQGLDKKTQEEKDTTYIEVLNSLTAPLPKLVEGKYYLVFMNYNDNFEKYQVLDTLLYEYDIETDKIRNTDTNEWEDYTFGAN